MTILKLSKLIAQYELGTLYSADKIHSFKFVIEIYQQENKFYPKVRRNDFFTIKPDNINELCSEELLVVDVSENWTSFIGKTEEEVLNKVIHKIKQNFAASH